MRALTVLALTAVLFGCAGAQPSDPSIQSQLDEFAQLSGRDNLVTAPTVELYEGFALVNVELEAGQRYVVFLAAAEGSGLDPDADILDPAGVAIAEAVAEGEDDTVTFEAADEGWHTVSVDLIGCSGSCPVGVAIARL